jgi:hypothetical protein
MMASVPKIPGNTLQQAVDSIPSPAQFVVTLRDAICYAGKHASLRCAMIFGLNQTRPRSLQYRARPLDWPISLASIDAALAHVRFATDH